MTSTPTNPFIPLPHTGVKYTDQHEHIDVDALFEQYQDDLPGLKHYVSKGIRGLEQNIRGYDLDLKGAERRRKADQARTEEAREESRLARLELATLQRSFDELTAKDDLAYGEDALHLDERMNKALDTISDRFAGAREIEHAKRTLEYLRSL
jgi:hypothetical protein